MTIAECIEMLKKYDPSLLVTIAEYDRYGYEIYHLVQGVEEKELQEHPDKEKFPAEYFEASAVFGYNREKGPISKMLVLV